MGFDATETRAHTMTVSFDLFEGQATRTPVYRAKVYDSNLNGNSGYRCYSYGVAGADIEDQERLGLRSFSIPTTVDELELRVAISGHGHDQGTFTDRSSYQTKNAAEFDENYYTLKINGEPLENKGEIYISCSDNYSQAGTCYYARANWCPGNPLLTQYWNLYNIPESRELTIDLDLEAFESEFDYVKTEGVAQYMITVDLVGYQLND